MAEYISLFWWGLFNHEEEVVVVNITEVEKWDLVNAHWNFAWGTGDQVKYPCYWPSLLQGDECETPLCVGDLVSSKDLVHATSISSSRANSVHEIENLLSSPSYLVTATNSGTELNNLKMNSENNLENLENNLTNLQGLNTLENLNTLEINLSSSNSGSIRLPWGPRGSWAPVVCTSNCNHQSFSVVKIWILDHSGHFSFFWMIHCHWCWLFEPINYNNYCYSRMRRVPFEVQFQK